MFKPIWLNEVCGTYCGYPGNGTMPRVFAPVTKPSDDRLAKLPAGLSLFNAVRKKLTRASFTPVDPNVFVLLITNSCAREVVVVGKPGTLGKPPVGKALSTLVLSRW